MEGNEKGRIISDEGGVVGMGGMVRGVKLPLLGGVVRSTSLGAVVDGVIVGTSESRGRLGGLVVGVMVVVLEGLEVGNDDGNRTRAEGSSDGDDDNADSGFEGAVEGGSVLGAW